MIRLAIIRSISDMDDRPEHNYSTSKIEIGSPYLSLSSISGHEMVSLCCNINCTSPGMCGIADRSVTAAPHVEKVSPGRSGHSRLQRALAHIVEAKGCTGVG